MEGLIDYQFRQLGVDAFEMLAEVSGKEKEEPVKREMEKQMREILREKQLEYVTFTVRFVEEIQPDVRTGKKKLIAA